MRTPNKSKPKPTVNESKPAFPFFLFIQFTTVSPVSALDESVRQLYAEHGHHTCVCPMPTRPRFPPSLQQQQPELHANNDDHQMTFPLPPEMPSEEEGNDADEAIDRHRNQHLMYNRRKNGWGSKSAGNDADDDGTSSTPTTTKTTTMPQLQLSPHCWHRFGFAFIRQLHPGADVLRFEGGGGEKNGKKGRSRKRRFSLKSNKKNIQSGSMRGQRQQQHGGGWFGCEFDCRNKCAEASATAF